MPLKSKKHKLKSAERREKIAKRVVSASKEESAPKYHATEYDKLLRKFTIRDTIKTIIITLILFAIQAGIFYAYQNNML